MIVVHPGEDLQAALDRARPGEIIQLAPGDYRAKAVISTGGVTLRGAGADRTRILWDDYAKKLDSRGVEYNTFRTWTVAVCADGVTMEDLAIVNDALHPEVKGQEVALTVYGDGFTMRRCRHYLVGGQRQKARRAFAETDKAAVSRRDLLVNRILLLLPSGLVARIFAIRWRGKA